MAIQLAQHCAQVEMGISQGPGLVDFELELQGLDEVRESSPHLARPSVVASHVIEGRRLEGQRVPGNQLGLPEMVYGGIKLLLLQLDHSGQVEVLAQFLGGAVELLVIDAVDALLDADDFLHDVDALVIFALRSAGVYIFLQDVALATQLCYFFPQQRVHLSYINAQYILSQLYIGSLQVTFVELDQLLDLGYCLVFVQGRDVGLPE